MHLGQILYVRLYGEKWLLSISGYFAFLVTLDYGIWYNWIWGDILMCIGIFLLNRIFLTIFIIHRKGCLGTLEVNTTCIFSPRKAHISVAIAILAVAFAFIGMGPGTRNKTIIFHNYFGSCEYFSLPLTCFFSLFIFFFTLFVIFFFLNKCSMRNNYIEQMSKFFFQLQNGIVKTDTLKF